MNKSKNIRVLIVDDEQYARDELKYLLGQHDDVIVIGEADNCLDAFMQVQKYQPHLVFLDIEMPDMTGIQAAERIMENNLPPLVVFATAHEEFALKAFDLNAVDYLLKPFSSKRVTRCIEKVRNLLKNSAIIKKPVMKDEAGEIQDQSIKHKLAIEHNGKVRIIDADNILMACCSDGQLSIYTIAETYETNMALQELQNKLAGNNFFRSHRAYLVNLNKVKEVVPWFNGTYNLIVDKLPNVEVPVSRQQAARLKRIFGL